MSHWRTIAMTVLAALCVTAFAFTTVISEPLAPLPIDPFWLAFAGLPVVGAVLTTKRPSNPVGWVVFCIGVAAAMSASTQLAAHGGLPRPDLLVLFNQLAFLPVFFLLPLFLLLFPDGDLPSPRWRLPVAVAGVLTAVLGVWFALRPVDYSFDNIEFFPNPWGIDQLAAYDGFVVGLLQLTLGSFGVAALIRAARSYRQAGHLRRAQVKWVLVPALLGPVVFVVGILLKGLTGPELGNLTVMAGLIGGGNGVAVGIRTAVLRHNLFEIDRIISRTVTYAVVGAAQLADHGRGGGHGDVRPLQRPRRVGDLDSDRVRPVQPGATTGPDVVRTSVQPLPIRRYPGHGPVLARSGRAGRSRPGGRGLAGCGGGDHGAGRVRRLLRE